MPVALLQIVLALLALGGTSGSRSAELPERSEVEAVVTTLRADPDLKPTRRVKVLQFRHQEPQKPVELPPWWIRWLGWSNAAFAWLADTMRWGVWLLGALAVALIAVSMRRWVRERADARSGEEAALLPSHVGALDVRPESLPDRIGAHARTLWQRGEHRAALSLMYRGALSRLIHVHAVPIRRAHTESECVRISQGRLQQEAEAFFARLVSVWQLSVYAGRAPEEAGVLSLCDQFDRVLGESSASGATR